LRHRGRRHGRQLERPAAAALRHARDLAIGMRFVTLEGKLVQSGGMVVKNVAGLDMAKLMIGSFGTLAAIAVVNFKLQPAPETERSFLLPFDSLARALAACNQILGSVLQPAAIDLLNPAAGMALGSAPGSWPSAPVAARPPWTATITNWRTSPAVWRSRAAAPRPSGRTWRALHRDSSTSTPMARLCALRVR